MEHKQIEIPEGWQLKKPTSKVYTGNRIWTVANNVGTWFTVAADSEFRDLGVDMFPAVIRKIHTAPNSTEIRRDARAHVARMTRRLRKSLGME